MEDPRYDGEPEELNSKLHWSLYVVDSAQRAPHLTEIAHSCLDWARQSVQGGDGWDGLESLASPTLASRTHGENEQVEEVL